MGFDSPPPHFVGIVPKGPVVEDLQETSMMDVWWGCDDHQDSKAPATNPPVWATACLMVGSALLLGAAAFILTTALTGRSL
jgi:hypothetical protein